ncbi:MAG TPA: helix-turn-helix transcriptional regulator [Steroidobacter sp.]
MRADSQPVVTTTSPPAVMCLDAHGVVLFATDEAHRLCALWNEGLKQGRHEPAVGLRLPAGIGSLLREVSSNGCDPIASGVRMRHPDKPELAVTIHMGSSLPQMKSRAYCLLMFDTDAPIAAPMESGSSAEEALRRLSPSERRVALLVAEGLRNEDIAQRLQRSRRTVEYQLHAIFRKLDMSRRTQLVRVLL